VTFADALLFLFELADTEDRRFQPAASRWHARFALEAHLTLNDSQLVMNLLCGLRSANRHVVRRRLLDQIARAGLTTREIG
jgi:hypothetical protein